MMKELFMRRGEQCSLQYHRNKHETFYIVRGKLRVVHGAFITEFKPGNYLPIKPGMFHRMAALKNTLYIECSTPHKDDTIRIKDEYGRL